MTRTALVTTALPYANGPLHLGHLVGYIQADIWVRARRMSGGKAWFVCADDTHGTPIMLAAEKAGVTPETFIANIQASHERDFAAFGVAFDHYDSTNSAANKALTEAFYLKLEAAGHISRRSVAQFYDPAKGMFLPDRYVKGICPNCGSADQYGDNCEVCGATYAPTDLKEPRSVISGATPEMRDSEHFFFEVGHFDGFLRDWLAGDVALPGVKAKLGEWLNAEGGLRAWDISRDAPYFGFEIPGQPGKYFYVWLDAPIGYLSSFQTLCSRIGEDSKRTCAPAPAPSCIISSARTSSISMACSGRRCCTAPAPRADPPARQRLPDRRWREDEQVARHLRDGAYVPRCRPGAGGTALLLRRQIRWWRRRPRPEPGRLHRARQRRSGRQVRQPRQPLRRFHQQALRWPVGRAAARRGAVPALRRWPCADP
jgi:hypothetical protein